MQDLNFLTCLYDENNGQIFQTKFVTVRPNIAFNKITCNKRLHVTEHNIGREITRDKILHET